MHEIILDLPHLPGGEVRLLGWLARPGQALRRGAPLCLVEQAGRQFDVPALRDGVVQRLIATPEAPLGPGAPLAALAAPHAAWIGDVPVPGGTLHVRRWPAAAASRGTCLLLHGFAGSLDTWVGTAAMLAGDGFVVVAPDLPGHGASQVTADTPQAIARMLADAWGHLGLTGPVHLIGHSMGGAIALLLAAAQPQRLASLTLVAPLGLGGTVDGSFLQGVLAASDAASLGAALRPLTARPMPQDAAALTAMLACLDRHRPMLRGLAAALADGDRQRLDLRAVLAELKLPARLIVGDADAVLPWAVIVPPPHVPLHRLPCGHMPHWEQPGLMRRLLAQHDWRAHAPHSGGRQ